MSRRESTHWTWEYAVREHDGKITLHDNRYNDGRERAQRQARLQNETLRELRLGGEAVVVRRRVTVTQITVTDRGSWEESV